MIRLGVCGCCHADISVCSVLSITLIKTGALQLSRCCADTAVTHTFHFTAPNIWRRSNCVESAYASLWHTYTRTRMWCTVNAPCILLSMTRMHKDAYTPKETQWPSHRLIFRWMEFVMALEEALEEQPGSLQYIHYLSPGKGSAGSCKGVTVWKTMWRRYEINYTLF